LSSSIVSMKKERIVTRRQKSRQAFFDTKAVFLLAVRIGETPATYMAEINRIVHFMLRKDYEPGGIFTFAPVSLLEIETCRSYAAELHPLFKNADTSALQERLSPLRTGSRPPALMVKNSQMRDNVIGKWLDEQIQALNLGPTLPIEPLPKKQLAKLHRMSRKGIISLPCLAP